MQAVTLWEVLWAEDYRDQMDCWTSTDTGGDAHTSVSPGLFRRFLRLNT